MPKVHLSTVRKMLMSPDPVDLTVVTANGDVETYRNVIGLKDQHYAGTRNVKFLNSGEIRRIRDVLIIGINGCEVFI